ncbi:MAG: nucleotidyltransferase family protein [Jiangellaceae bacterium]
MSIGSVGDSVPGADGNGASTDATDPDLTLVAVAAHGLAGSRIRPPSGPLDQSAWRQLTRSCSDEHLVGLLAATVDSGVLRIADDQAADLAAMTAGARARSAAVCESVVQVSRTLDAEGIVHLVLNGPVIAIRAYADPAVRDLGAADVLVDASQVPTPSPQDATVRFRNDLLPADLGQPVGLAEARQHPTLVHVDGHPIPALPAEAQLVYACAQATPAPGAERLLALRDVAQLALSDDLDPASVARFVGPGRAMAVVAGAVRLAWQRFDLADKTRLSVWAARYDAVPVSGRLPRPRADGARPGRRVGTVAQRITAVLAAPVRKVGG